MQRLVTLVEPLCGKLIAGHWCCRRLEEDEQIMIFIVIPSWVTTHTLVDSMVLLGDGQPGTAVSWFCAVMRLV